MIENNDKWTRLDNAAKLYASTSSRRDPKIFRFACHMREPIDPERLRKAAEEALFKFPHYKTVLRRGLFWYFLEPAPWLSLNIREEDRSPCSPMFDEGERKLLIDVTYFQQRINVEICHVLTDGTGAMQFLREMVMRYLCLQHPKLKESAMLDYSASVTEKITDSFDQYYGGTVGRGSKMVSAAHVRGFRLPGIRVTEGNMDAKKVLDHVRTLNTSLTPFLCARLMIAIAGVLPLRELRRPVALTIPVNLRNYFQSESARNFFAVFTVSHKFLRADETEAEVLASIKSCFDRELTRERITERMNRMAAVEHNSLARILPLPLKDLSLAIGGRVSRRTVTGGVSNMGRIAMPEAFSPYIDHLDVFMSTDHIQLCACSYGGRLVLSLTAPFVSRDVQKRFFRAFAEIDPDMTLATND